MFHIHHDNAKLHSPNSRSSIFERQLCHRDVCEVQQFIEMPHHAQKLKHNFHSLNPSYSSTFYSQLSSSPYANYYVCRLRCSLALPGSDSYVISSTPGSNNYEITAQLWFLSSLRNFWISSAV